MQGAVARAGRGHLSACAAGRVKIGMKKRKAPHQADTRGGRWLGIPHAVIGSEAFRCLDPLAKLVLLSIVMRFNGRNNGKIAVSYRQIAYDLNRQNQNRLSGAIAQLIEHGLVEIATEGKWGPRKAREYRLTFVSSGTDAKPVAATNEYLRWHPIKAKPRKSRATPRVAGCRDSATAVGADLSSGATRAVASATENSHFLAARLLRPR